MRVVRREAERAIDPRLELFGDHVLEPVGLVVHGVEVQAERLREIELEQPVMADHFERDPLARLGELRAAIRLVLEQFKRGQLLHHRRGGCG